MPTILVICAHSDDQVFGAGGTIAKYAKEGYDVKTIILSYGEVGNFWMQEHITIQTRVKESEHADKVIKGKGVKFFDLVEGKFASDAKKKGIIKQLVEILRMEQPSKIFTHSTDDPLKDHRDTVKLVLKAVKQSEVDADIYSFNVWNVFNIKKEIPRLIVDISETFPLKLKALKCFESQKHARFLLSWSVYAKAFFHGIQNNRKWVEVFHKIQ